MRCCCQGGYLVIEYSVDEIVTVSGDTSREVSVQSTQATGYTQDALMYQTEPYTNASGTYDVTVRTSRVAVYGADAFLCRTCTLRRGSFCALRKLLGFLLLQSSPLLVRRMGVNRRVQYVSFTWVGSHVAARQGLC